MGGSRRLARNGRSWGKGEVAYSYLFVEASLEMTRGMTPGVTGGCGPGTFVFFGVGLGLSALFGVEVGWGFTMADVEV